MKDASTWKLKVHPFFIHCALAKRQAIRALNALGPNPPVNKTDKILAQLNRQLRRTQKKHGKDLPTNSTDPLDIIFVAPGYAPGSPAEHDQNFLELIYFERYREPLWIACQKSESGGLEALEALRRISRISEEYQRHRFNLGGLKPPKGDLEHFQMFEIGFDLGLNELSAEQLADCFDELCPCGNEIHDPDSLKKQRQRFRNLLRDAEHWLHNEQTKIPKRELLFVYGKGGLYAKAVGAIAGKPRLVYVGLIGSPAFCAIGEKGSLIVVQTAIDLNAASEQVPLMFNVGSLSELFQMFFPLAARQAR
jgi:hypothetical protein